MKFLKSNVEIPKNDAHFEAGLAFYKAYIILDTGEFPRQPGPNNMRISKFGISSSRGPFSGSMLVFWGSIDSLNLQGVLLYTTKTMAAASQPAPPNVTPASGLMNH